MTTRAIPDAEWGPNPRLADALFALITFVAVAIPMATNHPNRGDRSVEAVAWLLPVLLAGAMFVRRRWPVPVLICSGVALLGYYVLRYPPVGLELPLAAAFYTVAEGGRVWWGIGYGALLQGVALSARLAQGQDEQMLFGFALPPAIALTAGALALGDATRQRRLQRIERARAEAAAALEHELEAERRVENERVHLARELHDVLAHTVSVIGIQAGVAAEAVEDDDKPAAMRSIEAIRSTSRDAMRDLRSTLGILRGDSGRGPVGSVAHLEVLADTARAAGLDVVVMVAPGLPPVPSATDTTAYRVVQESLTNVLRHSGAQRAVVQVAHADGLLEVSVTDDGQGRPDDTHPPQVRPGAVAAANGAGHGLRGMRERVNLVGGELDAGPLPGGTGFRVHARLPL